MRARRVRADVAPFVSRLPVWVLAIALVLPQLIALRNARADDTATARIRFQEGVDLYDKGQFDKARGAFLQRGRSRSTRPCCSTLRRAA